MRDDNVRKGILVPGMPHPYLCPEKNEGWQRVRDAYDKAREEIEQTDAEIMVIYSTFWPSILGHQILAFPEPEWTYVDEEFHDLGSIPYKFRLDPEFAELAVDKCKERGLHARTVSYYGFPIDIGSILALKLLNPDNRLPAIIVSSNMYANRAETIVLGKSVRDAIDASGKKAVVVVVSALSNRLHTLEIKSEDDKIHSLKDHEWNLKFLEYLDKGRLEDVSQLSRQFHEEARVPKVVSFKPFWIMASMMGQTNLYEGNILAYEPVWGTGSAVVTMTPAEDTAGDLEYDEDDPEFYKGDREVLDFYEQPGMGPLEEEDGD